MCTDFIGQLREQQLVCKKAGLWRNRIMLDGPQETHVAIDGQDFLVFCSNDYLGLANHPALIEAVADGAQRYGIGAGASHLIIGHSTVHHKLEEALARFVGFPRTLLFSTGYMANIGVVSALLDRGDAVFADKLNHASLNEAALLSRAKFIRYPHADMSVLEKRLAASKSKRKLVMTDAVFSMDGDIAPISEILALCEKYDALLLLDDAHGFGVLGAQGRGTLSLFEHGDIQSPNIIYMATLGKAAGVFGAFVAAQPEVIETLIQHARSYIYTTATPALLSYTLLRSLALVEQEVWRRERLKQLVTQLKAELQSLRWPLLPSDTPIQPLIIGKSETSMQITMALRDEGILVPAIRPPTVPEGSARLRISLSALHSEENVKRLTAVLRKLAMNWSG